ncbi:MAG: putative transposase, partial [Solirubrobacteraceae bacterium]
LRRLASEGGTALLTPPTGRPPKLDQAARERAYEMSDRGVPGSEIARVLGVSQSMISLLLLRRPVREHDRLPLSGPEGSDTGQEISDTIGVTEPVEVTEPAVTEPAVTEPVVTEPGEVRTGARIVEGGGRSVYAGAMLLHPFLEKVGAGGVLSALESGPARCYDTTAVALAGTFAFALGTSSLEGSKHLQLSDAGLLVGSERFPHLRTLRPRLGVLADSSDPLAVQAALAKAMLDADSEPPSVFFVDEHFVAYTGSRPVAKGWNTRRRHAEPGRHETVIVDDRWRAVCFQSGPPGGLAKGMLSPIDQLQAICPGRRLMIGFDRGGAYPKAFSELRDRGIDWVTYRRAPLAEPTVKPRRSWVRIDGRRRYLRVADERVTLKDYGQCRQLTVYEHGRVVLQILTSDLSTPAARLAHTLRCRWCIENTFKYLEDHHGLHWLCDYQMTLAPDTALVRNPERTTALAKLRAHEQTVTELEQQIGAHHTATPGTDSNPAETLCMLQADLHTARAEVRQAKAALKPIPAKLPANTIDPDAQRATPRVNRRALQTVLRLLAYNSELDLARALNSYLQDPDEYRAITRHLLHQPGQIHYTPTTITVTIDPPHAPRIARAMNLLIDQINHQPPKLAGDHRPITYQTTTTP